MLCKAKKMMYFKSLICRIMLHCKTKPLFRLDNSQVPAHGTIHCSVCQSPKREVHPSPYSPISEQSFFLSAHRKFSASPCSWMLYQTLRDFGCQCNLKGAGCPIRKYNPSKMEKIKSLSLQLAVKSCIIFGPKYTSVSPATLV